MNNAAMTIKQDDLLKELKVRIKRRDEQNAEENKKKPGRTYIYSYMENLGWPELFNFDMNKYLDDADFCLEQAFRQRIWWLDNVNEDGNFNLGFGVDTGMYWDMELFGMKIKHTGGGVPLFQPHPFNDKLDVKLLGKFDFYKTGPMPKLLDKYAKMQKLSKERYGGEATISMNPFHRGPLDMYVQLRGYENFLGDISDNPEGFRDAIFWITDERGRYKKELQAFLNSKPAEPAIHDDWVNIPFISPAMFEEFVVPIYKRIIKNEGPVTSFHTCGNMEDVVTRLTEVLPALKALDVSAWNDPEVIDSRVPDKKLYFGVSILNAMTLSNNVNEQKARLLKIKNVMKHRAIGVGAQAIVKLLPTYEETIARLNRFIDMAKKTLNQ